MILSFAGMDFMSIRWTLRALSRFPMAKLSGSGMMTGGPQTKSAAYPLTTPTPWVDWMDFWNRAVRILSEFYLTPPPTLSQLTGRFRQYDEEQLLETLLTVPVKDIVERYFESDEIKAMVSAPGVDQGDISAPGSAYITAFFRYSAFRDDRENYGIVRGGMGSITQSMARSAEANGVSIRTNAEVKKILTEYGHATGVELVDGQVLNSDIVVSNADPKRTFRQLLDPADPGRRFLGGRPGR